MYVILTNTSVNAILPTSNLLFYVNIRTGFKGHSHLQLLIHNNSR